MSPKTCRYLDTEDCLIFFSETHSEIRLYIVGSLFIWEYKKLWEHPKYSPKVYFQVKRSLAKRRKDRRFKYLNGIDKIHTVLDFSGFKCHNTRQQVDLFLPSIRTNAFFIRFGQERCETSEIRVKVNEFPHLSFLPEECSGKILD